MKSMVLELLPNSKNIKKFIGRHDRANDPDVEKKNFISVCCMARPAFYLDGNDGFGRSIVNRP